VPKRGAYEPCRHGSASSHREYAPALRDDIEIVDDPQLKAMFETAAEVLGGLAKAFNDYERKNEPAWRKVG
jgi:hypothetical protein